MASLPPIKRFIADDFAGVTTFPAFCQKLFYPLNLFLNATYSALNSGLTIEQNTLGLINESTSITSNSSGIATTTINWPYTQTAPIGVVVMDCTNNGTSTNYPFVSWSYSAGVVSISMQFFTITSGAFVTAPTGTYNITFWVSGG